MTILVFVAALRWGQHWEETNGQEVPDPGGSAGLWIFVAVIWVSNMGIGTIWFEASCCTLSFMVSWANVDQSQPHPPNASHIILVPPLSQSYCWCDSAASQLRQPISWKITSFCCCLQQFLEVMWSLECQCWWDAQGLCSQDSWGCGSHTWCWLECCGTAPTQCQWKCAAARDTLRADGRQCDWRADCIADWWGYVAGVDGDCFD